MRRLKIIEVLVASGLIVAFLAPPKVAVAEEGFGFLECLIYNGKTPIALIQSTPAHFSTARVVPPKKTATTDEELLANAWDDFQETNTFGEDIAAAHGKVFAEQIKSQLGHTCQAKEISGSSPHKTEKDARIWMEISGEPVRDFYASVGTPIEFIEITLP